MKNSLLRSLFISIVIGISGFIGYCTYSENLSEMPLPTTGFSMTGKMNYVPGEVLVKYKTPSRKSNNGINVSSLNSVRSLSANLYEQNLLVEDIIPEGNIAVISIQDDKTVEETIALLENDKNVEYVEPNYIYYSAVINTNDSYTGNLWGLENIDWTQAYQVFSGSFSTSDTGILIGVVDEGVNYNHEDLASNMWSNYGYDFVYDDPNPMPTIGTHGTHVAGTIAAVMGNNKGIIGVNPNAKIMSLKFLDVGGGTTEDAIKAIDYAIASGVKIINASWGGPDNSSLLYQAIQRFRDSGGLFIAAAGNYAENNDTDPFYPCSYDLDNIICVAATTETGLLASFSNFGSTSVDVGAPGTNILSTIINVDGEEVEESGILTHREIIGNEAEAEENAIFYQQDFFGCSTGSLYNSGWRRGSGEIMCEGSIIFIDNQERAVSGTYIQSPEIDITLDGDYDVWINTDILCVYRLENEGVILKVNTGAGWQSIPYYYESRGERDVLYSNFNLGKISSLQYGFYFQDNPYDSGCNCWVREIDLKKYNDYEGHNNWYGYLDGTSTAAPHVVGLASLAWNFRPDLTYLDIKNAILDNGDSLASLSGKTVSGKRINVYKTLVDLDNYSPESPTLLTPSSGYQYTGFDTTLQVPFEWSASHDTGVGVSGYIFELSNNNEFSELITGITLDDTGLNFDITSTGMYYWRVKGFDKKGNTGEDSEIYRFSAGNLSCEFNGNTVNHGESVTGYENSTVLYGSSCVSEIRTCINGTLSGSYLYSSCTEGQPASCTFSGNTVNHGESVTGYESSTVPYGEICRSEIRTCTNGYLSGSYLYSSCTEGQPTSCMFSGNTVNHGESVTGYESSTVPYGSSCVSEIRTCTNGTLSGSYGYSSCSVENPASCEFNGNTVNHGESVTGYESSIVPYGLFCVSEIRTCINGTLSGSYGYSSCAVQPELGKGWVKLRKDKCPNGDYSDSYYDGTCEKSIKITYSSADIDGTKSSYYRGEELKYDKSKYDSKYSEEMNQAYQYAYHYGITTKGSIKDADVTGRLTRVAMAKMLSQYAVNVLGITLDSNNFRNCKFSDVTMQMDRDYNNGVTLACQLGIMGVGIRDFRPKDTVTRAEFVTALSRLLYGIEDGKDVYYSTHMNLLEYLGIITNTDPKLKETRGYVMLMLMRSEDN